MFSHCKCLLLLLFLLLIGKWDVEAQELQVPTDTTLTLVGDTIAPVGQDSLAVQDSVAMQDSVAKKKAGLDAPVSYQAKDSIIMTGTNWAYLFGESDVKYQQIELQSEKIEMNMDSSLVYATFGLDSAGQEFGYPLFIDGDQQYESKTMRYNFDTEKGYITDVIIAVIVYLSAFSLLIKTLLGHRKAHKDDTPLKNPGPQNTQTDSKADGKEALKA